MAPILKTWFSGQVVRKHTMMNLRAENNSEHGWGCVHVLMTIHPDPGLDLVTAVQYHDFGEKEAGDVPAPTKWSNPEVNAAVEAIETQHSQNNLPHYVYERISNLHVNGWKVVEFCDRADFCLSMYREFMMGNLFAIKPFKRSFAKMVDAAQYLADHAYNDTVIANMQGVIQELNEVHFMVSKDDLERHDVQG